MQIGINIMLYYKNVSDMRYSKITYKIKHNWYSSIDSSYSISLNKKDCFCPLFYLIFLLFLTLTFKYLRF